MHTRKVASIAAVGFIGAGLAVSPTSLFAQPPGNVVVEGKRIVDPSLQRRVSYADLNLAYPAGQNVLRGRISRTAGDICFDNNSGDLSECRDYAIRSTHGQFAAAVDRAQRQMAGLPVGPAVAISMVIGTR